MAMISLLNFLKDNFWIFPPALFAFMSLRHLVIAGGSYLVMWKIFKKPLRHRRIQQGEPVPGQKWREMKNSLLAFSAMSAVGTFIFYCYTQGWTAIYHSWDEASLWWIPAGFLIIFYFHDFYFYWTHRLLHQKWFFKNVHYVHHTSKIPTPFASHSFHWFEGIIQISFLIPIVFFVPFHPWTFVIAMIVTHFFATWGHFNYEMMPTRTWNSWWGSWVTTSTHHNHHHLYVSQNYGLYLKFWDAKFGTLNPKTDQHFREKMLAPDQTPKQYQVADPTNNKASY